MRKYRQSEASRKYEQSEERQAARRRKVECECGAEVCSRNLSKHRRSPKHKRWLEEAERLCPALS